MHALVAVGQGADVLALGARHAAEVVGVGVFCMAVGPLMDELIRRDDLRARLPHAFLNSLKLELKLPPLAHKPLPPPLHFCLELAEPLALAQGPARMLVPTKVHAVPSHAVQVVLAPTGARAPGEGACIGARGLMAPVVVSLMLVRQGTEIVARWE